MAFVSGGKIIAISKVKTDETITGDGALHPLHVVGGGSGGGEKYKFIDGEGIHIDMSDYIPSFSGYNVTIGLKEKAFTQASADTLYASKNAITDMETKTHAAETYQPKGDYALKTEIPDVYTKTESDERYAAIDHTHTEYLTKASADNDYQPKGDYALKKDVYTKTESDELYATKNHKHDEYLTKTSADNDYQPKGNYVTSAGFDTFSTKVENSAAQLKKSIDEKLDSTEYKTWSAAVENSAHNLDEEIKTKLPTSEFTEFTSEYGTWSAKVENSAASFDEKITENAAKIANKYDTSAFNEFNNTTFEPFKSDYDLTKADYSTFSGKVVTSADNLSAYIASHEEQWSIDTTYTAGTGIDKTKFAKNEIALDPESAARIEAALTEHQSLAEYYKKNETSGAQEIADALAGKQPAGDYVTSAGFTGWETTEYEVFKGEYSTFSAGINSWKQLIDNSAKDWNGLQTQIDAIIARSDVVDVVGTYKELTEYDTTKLGDNDIVKVLKDENEDNAETYYRWLKSSSTFELVGSVGEKYTKAEIDEILGDYYQKNETSGAADIQAALNEKQDAGNYVETETFEGWVDTDYTPFKQDYATFSGKVVTSADKLSAYAGEVSAYIHENESEWIKGTSYEAGEWIDSDKLKANEIAVSGVKNLIAIDPLIISETETGDLQIGIEGSLDTHKRLLNITSKADAESSDKEITATWNAANESFTITFKKIGWYQFSCNALFKPLPEAALDEYSECGFTSDSVRVGYKQPVYNYITNGTFVSCTSLVNITQENVTLTFFHGTDQELTENIDVCIMEV